MRVRHSPGAPRWRGLPMATRDFSVSLVPKVTTIDPTTTYVDVADVVVKRMTGQATITAYDLVVQQDLTLPPPRVENLTPGVFTTQGSQLVGQGSNSTGRLRVTGYAGAREFDVRFPDQAPATTETDDSFVVGTLAAHCMNNLLARLAGKSPGGLAQNVFQEANHGYTLQSLSCSGYNQSSIVAGLDLACVQFASGRIQPGVNIPAEHRVPSLLVGPRHVIAAYHAMNYPGERMFWRRNDGSFAEAVVTAVRDLGSDMGVALLDRDVTGIQFARVLPQDWPEKLKAPYVTPVVQGPVTTLKPRGRIFVGIALTGNTSPGLGFLRHAQLFGISQMGHLPSDAIFSAVVFGAPAQPELAGWYSVPYGGDSNSPMFVIIEQAGTQVPVFVTSFFTAGSGPSYGAHVNLINQTLSQLSAEAGDSRPFNLVTADLSAFPALI